MKGVDLRLLKKYFTEDEFEKIEELESAQKIRFYGIPGKKIAIITPSGQKDPWIMTVIREFFKGEEQEQKMMKNNKVYLIRG